MGYPGPDGKTRCGTQPLLGTALPFEDQDRVERMAKLHWRKGNSGCRRLQTDRLFLLIRRTPFRTLCHDSTLVSAVLGGHDPPPKVGPLEGRVFRLARGGGPDRHAGRSCRPAEAGARLWANGGPGVTLRSAQSPRQQLPPATRSAHSASRDQIAVATGPGAWSLRRMAKTSDRRGGKPSTASGTRLPSTISLRIR